MADETNHPVTACQRESHFLRTGQYYWHWSPVVNVSSASTHSVHAVCPLPLSKTIQIYP